VDRIHRVRVSSLPGEAPSALLSSDIAALGIGNVDRVERHDLYYLRGALSDEQVAQLCDELLSDPVTQRAQATLATDPVVVPKGAVRIEVGLLHGVTDSVATNLMQRAQVLGMEGLRAAAYAQSYLLYGDVGEDQVHTIARRLLCNDVIQHYTLDQHVPPVGVEPHVTEMRADPVPIADLDDEQLVQLSRDRLLSLDAAEMRAIQRYFAREGREPTDVELESLAQTWSEHCVHKTFKAIFDYVEYNGSEASRERIDSLIGTYLQAATCEIDAPWVRSAFVDNAGILDFDKQYEVSFKVETHNHPSALEPFGGANTGVGGVVRDIMGGIGATYREYRRPLLWPPRHGH